MQQTWQSLSVEETIKKLSSGLQGLSEEEAAYRIEQFGYNEIPEAGKRSWVAILLKQFKSAIFLILLVAALISAMTGDMIDVYVILAVIAINATIGFVQEMRAERAIASLKSMLAPTAKVIRNGKKKSIAARELVPGDIIVLEEGDNIPADARLIEVKNLRTMEAALTGESVPIIKRVDPLPASTSLADCRNIVWKGTFVAGGYALAIVTTTGIHTAIGDIARTLKRIKAGKTNFQKKTDRLARQMALIAVVSASALFLVSYFFYRATLEEIMLISIATLVSSIPEGLPAVLSIVLAIGAYRMSQRKAIIREFTATETLGAVTTIITDKTGTLTQNSLTIKKISVYGSPDVEVTGDGWSPTGVFQTAQQEISVANQSELLPLLRIARWCNNAELVYDEEKKSYQLIGDPTEGALLVMARKAELEEVLTAQKTDDLPFNSLLKLRASLIEFDQKKQLIVVGAPEQLLDRCSSVLTKQGTITLTAPITNELQKKIEQWSENALRVIALAYRDEPLHTKTIDENKLTDLVFAGIVGMIDPPRPDVAHAVALCRQAGIRVIMATGDHVNTAVAIARATGIMGKEENEQTAAITEKQLLQLNEKEFEEVVIKINVFARLTPIMKMRIAEKLQQKGELIAMTGDGVNDAPALKKADVGVAMGIMGTDVARDAAKVVLADDNFSTIVNAVEEGRIVFTNARQTSFFLVTTNVAEVFTLISAISLGLPPPLTATQILWLNLVTDGVCDISLATEKGHGDVLQEKPIDPKENILNKSIIPFLIINASLMTLLALGVFIWYLPKNIEKARSAAFITMAFCQLFNALNMRSLKLSLFQIGPLTNKYLIIAIVFSIIVQAMIIEVPFLERLFRFEPVSAGEFMTFALLASVILWAGELYKFFRYRYFRKAKSP